jgi:hypothetical protein
VKNQTRTYLRQDNNERKGSQKKFVFHEIVDGLVVCNDDLATTTIDKNDGFLKQNK